MLNNFISALITIFFSGVASKETEEKTKRASWMRVFIYGVLATIVGAFFYKTYQVATIVNMVEVLNLRTKFDGNGLSNDTIEQVVFFTRFSEDKTYSNRIVQLERKRYLKYPANEDYGGVVYSVSTEVVSPSDISWNKEIPEIIKRDIKLPEGTMHAHGIHFFTTNVPKLIPIAPDVHSAWTDFVPSDDSKYYLERHRASSFNYLPKAYVKFTADEYLMKDDKLITLQEALGDGICLGQTMCEIGIDERFVKNNRFCFYGALGGSMINKMNFLTAADVSQFTYVVGVNSQLPVKNIQVITDIPIELSATDKWIKPGPFGFDMEDSVSNVLNKCLTPVHIKLPTLANLQLIRSLILTTLITALVSLFAVNLYYCIRRSAMRYRKKHAMPVSKLRHISKFRITLFRYTMNIIMVVLGVAICIWSWMLLKNQSLAVDLIKIQNHFELILALFIIASLLIIITLLYWYSHRAVSDESFDEELEPPTIFLHERSEEEELDRLFNGLPEEDMLDQEEVGEEENIENDGNVQ